MRIPFLILGHGLFLLLLFSQSMAATASIIHAKLRWHTGTADSDVVFGVIRDIKIADNGDVWTLDRQLCQVLHFDCNGQLLHMFGRPGEGPDDFREPMAIDINDDGRLVVFEAQPAIAKYFTFDGVLSEQRRLSDYLPPNSMLTRAAIGDAAIIMAGCTYKYGDESLSRCSWLRIVPDTADSTAMLYSSQVTTDLSNIVIDEREQRDFVSRWDVGNGNVITIAPMFDHAQVMIIGNSHTTIELPVVPVQRSHEEIDKARKAFLPRDTNKARQMSILVSQVHEAVPAVYSCSGTEFWCWLGIAAAEAEGGNCLGTFAVVSGGGSEVRLVTVFAVGLGCGEMFAIGKDRMVVVKGLGGVKAAAGYRYNSEGIVHESNELGIEYYEIGSLR